MSDLDRREEAEADRWEAGTSDGREWCEHDTALHVDERSPWRELEAICQREQVGITWASVTVGPNTLRIEAEGCPIECGHGIHTRTRVTAGGMPTTDDLLDFMIRHGIISQEMHDALEKVFGVRYCAYAFACRVEEARRVWAIVSEAGQWVIEGPPDRAMMPDPFAIPSA